MADLSVYALFHLGPTGEKCYFYVGRSFNPARRKQQHLYETMRRHEDVYVYLRILHDQGTPWHSEILETVSAADWWPDVERWTVIRLIREGHELKNMRHGSVIEIVRLAELDHELAEQIQAPNIRSAMDVRADRERRASEARHASLLASRRLRRRVNRVACERLLKKGIRDVVSCSELKALLPVTYRRLLRRDVTSIGRGMELHSVIKHARDEKKWIEIHNMRTRFGLQ